MNIARHEAFVDGQPIQLTLAEFRLLQSLIANRGRVLTREQILGKITDGERTLVR